MRPVGLVEAGHAMRAGNGNRRTCATGMTWLRRTGFVGPASREDAQASDRIGRHQLRHAFDADHPHEIAPQELERIIRAEVPRHHLHPDQHVGPGPRLRLEPQQGEFRRQRAAVMCRDERVHAGDIGVDLRFGRFRGRGPRGSGGAAEADRPQEAILRDGRTAKDLREPAIPNPALKFHLPQPILRVHVAQPEQRIHLVRGEDVRDRIGIPDDIDWSGDRRAGRLCAWNDDCTVEHGQRAPSVDVQRQACGGRNDQGKAGDDEQRLQCEPHGEILLIADCRFQISDSLQISDLLQTAHFRLYICTETAR